MGSVIRVHTITILSPFYCKRASISFSIWWKKRDHFTPLVTAIRNQPRKQKQNVTNCCQRWRHWERNCVAIGLSAGFLEPLESTSIGLIQLAIVGLLQMFPDREFAPEDATEFDRMMRTEFERLRDFLILHYCATERDDTPFWRHCRSMPVPDALTAQLELFRERGYVVSLGATDFQGAELAGGIAWTASDAARGQCRGLSSARGRARRATHAVAHHHSRHRHPDAVTPGVSRAVRRAWARRA